MKEIRWGMIGCGDVTEVKSGPAFSKIPGSSLVAVMSRDPAKAQGYAGRHHVAKWYADAGELLHDPDVNAIYVATPPQSHEDYAIQALQLGKPVYVEKPMALTAASCLSMTQAAEKYNTKLTVAHYRRALPVFLKVKELLASGAIGDIRFVKLDILQSRTTNIIVSTKDNWRTNPAISGGGLFHDIAPHHIDIMIWLFGEPEKVDGYSANLSKWNGTDDIVSGEMVFGGDVIVKGLWCFSVPESENKDLCEITGTEGRIEFSFHKDVCRLHRNGTVETFDLKSPLHIQQPMIEKVVEYFRGEGPNPCSGADGATVLHIMDVFTGAK